MEELKFNEKGYRVLHTGLDGDDDHLLVAFECGLSTEEDGIVVFHLAPDQAKALIAQLDLGLAMRRLRLRQDAMDGEVAFKPEDVFNAAIFDVARGLNGSE